MKEFKSAFKPAIEEYLEFRSAMGYCNEHEQQLRYFDKYCYEHFPEQTELTKEVVRGWFYDEIASGRACLSSKATTIRLFARYLGSSAYVLPMNCVPKTPDYLPYILTDEELAALFQAADTMEYKNDPFFQKTASTLLRLLYACGLRPNEGRNLKVEHINFQTGELFITKTKRRKERIVVVSGDMLLLLKKYRLQRAVFDKGNEYFFIHTDSTAIKSWQLTALVKSCWIAAHPGIDPKVLPRVRPYDLRHRFASTVLHRWLDEGRNLYAMLPYLRAYMGHEKFSDTAYYIHILPERLMVSPGVQWDNIDRIGMGGGYMGTLSPLFTLVRSFFLVFLPEEQKCSQNTIRSYRKSLELLFDFVKERNSVALNEITFEMMDRNTVSEFLSYLETERNCSISTRNHRLHCIRAFFKYAAQEDITVIAHLEEIQKVKRAKQPETIVEHMSEDAVRAILKQPDTYTEKGKRDAFLLLFLYKTGARVQELVDIRLCDIQLGKYPKVTIHGKGAKTRSIPLRDDVVQHLKKYLALFHPEQNLFSEQYLFYVTRNQNRKRMTEDNVRKLIAKYGVQARKICKEVPENVHPHLFRHSWAMVLYQNGVDLTLISQWLGHSNLETTLIYAHADTELKRKALEKAVPVDSPLKEHLNAERYKVSDEELLKRLCGLK